jgi:capsular polysaccharide biosynthesis protein
LETKYSFDVLRRRGLLILIVTVAALAIAIVAGILLPPTYRSTTTVRVLLEVGLSDFILREDYNERLLNTYAEMVTSEPILREALTRTSGKVDSSAVRQLGRNVEANVVPDTELITISVEDRLPLQAMDRANVLAQLLIEYAQELYMGTSKSTREIVADQLLEMEDELRNAREELSDLLAQDAPQSEIEALASEIRFREDSYDRLLVRYELASLNESIRANSITTVEAAQLPMSASNAVGLREYGLAVFVGILAGIGLAVVVDSLDTRIYSREQLEDLTDLPILATVPKGFVNLGDPRELSPSVHVLRVEDAYRVLATNLQFLLEENPDLRTLMVTCAKAPQEKALVANSVVQALGERLGEVCLVETDLRHPSLAKALGIEDGPVLSDVLTQSKKSMQKLLDSLYRAGPGSEVAYLPAGLAMARPIGALSSPRLDDILKYLISNKKAIIVEAPPVTGIADVSILAPSVDGIILVVRSGMSRRTELQEALNQLRATRAQILGLVFRENGAKS